MATPQRTCIGCRRRQPQSDLVRLVADHGRVRTARRGAPGGGAYLCADVACLEAADGRHAFARAFRGPVTLDASVREAVAQRDEDERR